LPMDFFAKLPQSVTHLGGKLPPKVPVSLEMGTKK